MLILLIFLAELAAAILAFIFREHVRGRACFFIAFDHLSDSFQNKNPSLKSE